MHVTFFVLVRGGEASEGSTPMPQKGRATRSRLQNLKTKNKKTKKKIYLASPLVTLPQIQTAETSFRKQQLLDETDTLDLDNNWTFPSSQVIMIPKGLVWRSSMVGRDTDVCEETASARSQQNPL